MPKATSYGGYLAGLKGMDAVYKIDAEQNVVRLCWSEFPSLRQLIEVIEASVADPDFKPVLNFLWDREPVPPSNPASIEYMREALYYAQSLAERIGRHSWALVCHDDTDFGKARMLESMSDGTKVTIRAFRSIADAEQWLRNPIPYEGNIPRAFYQLPGQPHIYRSS